MSRYTLNRRIAAAALLTGLTTAPALAGPMNLITDGTFDATGVTSGKIGAGGVAPGWTNNIYSGTTVGYNFLYLAGTADKSSSPLQLWGTNNGGLNTITNPPTGGNFVGMDGAYQQGSLSQTLTTLVAGTYYYVSFEWAGAQQNGFSGITTEQFAVALQAGTTPLAGTANCTTSGVQCTNVLTDQSHGFTGWNASGFTFLATAAIETLSFVAIGTPNGEPPFSLLSDISLQVPEPSSLALLATTAGLLLARHRRRTR